MKISGTVVFVSPDERRCVVKYDEGYAVFRLKKRKRVPDPGDLVKAKFGEDGAGKIRRGKKKNKTRFVGSWPRSFEAIAQARQG